MSTIPRTLYDLYNNRCFAPFAAEPSREDNVRPILLPASIDDLLHRNGVALAFEGFLHYVLPTALRLLANKQTPFGVKMGRHVINLMSTPSDCCIGGEPIYAVTYLQPDTGDTDMDRLTASQLYSTIMDNIPDNGVFISEFTSLLKSLDVYISLSDLLQSWSDRLDANNLFYPKFIYEDFCPPGLRVENLCIEAPEPVYLVLKDQLYIRAKYHIVNGETTGYGLFSGTEVMVDKTILLYALNPFERNRLFGSVLRPIKGLTSGSFIMADGDKIWCSEDQLPSLTPLYTSSKKED